MITKYMYAIVHVELFAKTTYIYRLIEIQDLKVY